MPEDEYECVPEAMVDDAVDLLNEHYEEAYGQTAGTYNCHIVCSHLKELREAGPLTSYNAYPFEGMYAEMRRAFRPGTRNNIICSCQWHGEHIYVNNTFYNLESFSHTIL